MPPPNKLKGIKAWAIHCEDVGICIAYISKKEAKNDEILELCRSKHKIIPVTILPHSKAKRIKKHE